MYGVSYCMDEAWGVEASQMVQAAQVEVMQSMQQRVVTRSMSDTSAFGWLVALQVERGERMLERQRRKAEASRNKPKKAFKGLSGGFFGSAKERKKQRKQKAAATAATAAAVAHSASAAADDSARTSARVAKKAAKPKKKKKFKDLMMGLTKADERRVGEPSPRTRGRAQLAKANPKVVHEKFNRV
jgi:hypothetical protein